jgi:choline dehydrogenase-like flavoprotein
VLRLASFNSSATTHHTYRSRAIGATGTLREISSSFKARGGIPIAIGEGRCVGGGTEINSAIFQRAPDEVIAGWANANHLLEFSPQTLAPFYDRSAEVVNASLTPGPPGPPTEILRRVGESMGWKTTALERGRRETSSRQHQVSGFATGAKQSMSATLIPDALGRGARLLPGCASIG